MNICRYVDLAFPGWVECSMVDTTGHEHLFVEKVPMVTADYLDMSGPFPQPGVIACVVIEKLTRDDGRQCVRIDTQTPWGIESTAGKTRFEVFAEQLSEALPAEGRR